MEKGVLATPFSCPSSVNFAQNCQKSQHKNRKCEEKNVNLQLNCAFAASAANRQLGLIRKIESIASENEAKKLHRQVNVNGRVKTQNTNVYYVVDDDEVWTFDIGEFTFHNAEGEHSTYCYPGWRAVGIKERLISRENARKAKRKQSFGEM